MKVAVIGANGQLGTDLCRELHQFEVIPLTHADIEITEMKSVKQALAKSQPEIVINTAANTNVDDCELNPDKAFLVNALGARNVAVVAHELGAKLVHISTNGVFGGGNEPGTTPYTEFDTPAPINVYGKSKLAGENFVQHLCPKHFIARTSGLFGIAGSRAKGGNFVDTILGLAQQKSEIKVTKDIFSPTYTRDLARKIAQLITTDYYGIFHITNKGACSRYEFAREIMKLAGLKVRLIPVSFKEYPTPAKRAPFWALDNYHLRLLGMMDDMRPWQEALKDYMIEKGHI